MIMKKIIILFFVFFAHVLFAQNTKIISLRKALLNAHDSSRANILNELSWEYLTLYTTPETDSFLVAARHYADEALTLSRNINYIKGTANALFNHASVINITPPKNGQIILTAYQAALPFLKQAGEQNIIAVCMQNIAESFHTVGKFDEAILYFDSVTHIVQKTGDTGWSVYTTAMKGHCYFDMGNYRDAYQVGIAALELAKKQLTDTNNICTALAHLANLFLGAGLPQATIEYVHKILEYYPGALMHKQNNLPWQVYWAMIKEGEAFLQLNRIDSAAKIAESIPVDIGSDADLFFGHLYTSLHQYEKALSFFKKGFQEEKESGHEIGTARHANELGRTYLLFKNFKSATHYAEDALATAQKIHALLEMKNAVGTLKDIYTQTKNYKEVYHYTQWYDLLSDSLSSEEYRRKLSLIQIQRDLDNEKQQALLLKQDNEIRKQQLNKEALVKKFFVAGIIGLLLIAGIVIRNNRQKQKANALLQKQKEEIQKTLTELKLTQAQLIQSEKMASLGELTAGIAHEIQNPLNFVNNFSEVSNELIDEMNVEIDKGNNEEVKAIASDIKQNLEKINHHGKRADAIVKGMLQHSQSNSGIKEPTNINSLTDQYLRLAYQGLRAKDKSFNATLKTDFDETIGSLNIIPQDIGRVLLNLYNNAFYAVTEKKKQAAPPPEGGIKNPQNEYEPTVTVKTSLNPPLGASPDLSGGRGAQVLIAVKDNGNGVPQKVVDKIFQPFFTTKPTGQGTGLGLSLSYDIVKAHGGEIKVESKEGEGSEFIISFPIV
jgi:two-component system, NtrC family, sensor kinase